MTVKSESVCGRYQEFGYKSYKYHNERFEETFSVDLYVPGKWNKVGLLLEATLSHKRGKAHSVDKVFKQRNVVRVLTDAAGEWNFNGVYYRIGYPKALLLVSSGGIYKLNTAKVLSS